MAQIVTDPDTAYTIVDTMVATVDSLIDALNKGRDPREWAAEFRACAIRWGSNQGVEYDEEEIDLLPLPEPDRVM